MYSIQKPDTINQNDNADDFRANSMTNVILCNQKGYSCNWQMMKKMKKSSSQTNDLTQMSVIPLSLQVKQDKLQVQWIPAEQIPHNPCYNSTIQDIDQLEFPNPQIKEALMILNWFSKDRFYALFDKQMNKTEQQQHYFYEFEVFDQGRYRIAYVDSYIPVSKISNQELYAKNFKGSIFPCLIEKLLAEVSGSYQNMLKLNVCDIILILSIDYSLGQTLRQRNLRKVKENMNNLQTFLKDQIQTNNNLVFFRTKGTKKILSYGLKPNKHYLISRIMQHPDQLTGIVQYLELASPDQQQGWIGKYSKYRCFWELQQKFIKENQILLESQNKQNYMCLRDMCELTGEITILENLTEFHKTWIRLLNDSVPNKKKRSLENGEKGQFVSRSVTSIWHLSVQYEYLGFKCLRFNLKKKQNLLKFSAVYSNKAKTSGGSSISLILMKMLPIHPTNNLGNTTSSSDHQLYNQQFKCQILITKRLFYENQGREGDSNPSPNYTFPQYINLENLSQGQYWILINDDSLLSSCSQQIITQNNSHNTNNTNSNNANKIDDSNDDRNKIIVILMHSNSQITQQSTESTAVCLEQMCLKQKDYKNIITKCFERIIAQSVQSVTGQGSTTGSGIKYNSSFSNNNQEGLQHTNKQPFSQSLMKSTVCMFKQLYDELGMSVIYIDMPPQINYKIQLKLDLPLLAQSNVRPLCPDQKSSILMHPGQKQLILFKCDWKNLIQKKGMIERIVFPPVKSVHVSKVYESIL